MASFRRAILASLSGITTFFRYVRYVAGVGRNKYPLESVVEVYISLSFRQKLVGLYVKIGVLP